MGSKSYKQTLGSQQQKKLQQQLRNLELLKSPISQHQPQLKNLAAWMSNQQEAKKQLQPKKRPLRSK